MSQFPIVEKLLKAMLIDEALVDCDDYDNVFYLGACRKDSRITILVLNRSGVKDAQCL